MTPLRLLPCTLFLAACGGEGGPSTPPVVMAQAAPSGDGQSGVVAAPLPLSLIVRLTQDGVPVEGRVVTFVAGVGAGSVSPSSVATGSNGLATATWTLGATSGQGQVQEVSGVFGQVLATRVQDAFGNGIPGASVGWAVTAGSGSVSAPTSITGADGRATMGATAGATPGALKVTATAAALPGAPVEFGLTVAPVATVIGVHNNFFQPADIVISAGGALRWSWVSGDHNVSPISGTATFPGSPTQSPGGS